VLLYTGKGGTGKSVISCATGIKTAGLGYDTLVLSSDPAHTLRDAFEKKITDEPTKVIGKLWAVQIDPIKEMQRNYAIVQEYVASLLAARGIDESLAYEIALIPGMTNLFSLLTIEEQVKQNRYDVLILDMVPSGEALKYLYFPKLFGRFSRKIMKFAGSIVGAAQVLKPLTGIPTPSGKVFDSEVELIQRLETLSQVLQDSSVTSLRLVTNPDAFAIENTRRTYLTSSLYGINVDLAVINKVLPSNVSDPYFEKWKTLQEKYMVEAETSLHPLPIKKLRLFESEVKGMDMLIRSGEELFGNEDPTQVYFKGNPFQIIQEKERLLLSIKVPFTEKDQCEVERIGDELTVKVQSEIGEISNTIPLPAITYKMKLQSAKLKNGLLEIYFERL